jgi:hypothetical protein
MDGSISDKSVPPMRAEGAASGTRLRNWNGSISYLAERVEKVRCAADIQRIVRDRQRYPSPVRVKGSHHSTTECLVNEGGTVIDLTGMDRIVNIDPAANTITLEAGALLIDAAKALEQRNLQFYVNIELGNLTVGSGACCGTKEASFHSSASGEFEYGQVASYAVGYRYVGEDGSLHEVREPDPLLPAMRSSYGMLGVIYEVTFRVKPLRAMALHHEVFDVREFAAQLDEIVREDRSSMLYLFPFLDKVVVERRSDSGGRVRSRWQWCLRNVVWEHISPGLARVLRCAPSRLRYAVIDNWLRFTIGLQVAIVRGSHTSPADQIIRYGEQGGFAAYTFSIWAFEKERYAQILLDYFAFCREHYRKNGYRCDMLNVGYAVAQDQSSLFSYTRNGFALTLDPVSTGNPGWYAFITEFNQFCSVRGGKPLFNQTPGLTPDQTKKAFGPEIELFQAERRKRDPEGRFYPPFFRELFE